MWSEATSKPRVVLAGRQVQAGGVKLYINENKKGGDGVLELDEYKMELGKYKTPLAEVRDSL